MTDLISPEDTGEMSIAETRVIFHQTADTAVIDLGDGTRRMPNYLATAPISPIPRGDIYQSGDIKVPDTIGIYPPFPLAPGHGRHALAERVGLYPVVRPSLPLRSGIRAERRAAARRDRRARVASVSLLTLLAAAVLALAVSGVVR